MEITRDDDDYLIVESKTFLAWLLAGAIALGPLGVGLYMHLNGGFWQEGASMIVLFGPLAALVMYQAPQTLYCFNRKARKVLVRRRWPWGAKEEVIAFKAIKGVSVDRIYSKDGVSYRPVLTLRDGRTLKVAELTKGDEAVSGHIAERIGSFLNTALPTDGTGKLPKGARPVKVATEAPPEAPTTKLVYALLTLVVLAILGMEIMQTLGGR